MSKPQPIISHMPWNIRKQILGHLNTKDKLSIRQCSKALKEHIDHTRTRFASLKFLWFPDNKKILIQWQLEGSPKKSVFFHKTPTGYLKESYPKTWSKNVEDEDYTDGAAEYFVSMLSMPGVTVGDVSIEYEHLNTNQEQMDEKIDIVKAFKAELLHLGHLIHVERLELIMDFMPDEILHVLPYIKPGVLKSIKLLPRKSRRMSLRSCLYKINVRKLVDLEQWKQAETLLLGSCYMKLPSYHTANFKAMSYALRELSIEKVDRTIQKVLQNDNCDWLRVYSNSFYALHRHLSKFEKLPQEDERITTYRIRSGDTECLVEVCQNLFQKQHVTIWNPKRCQGKQYY